MTKKTHKFHIPVMGTGFSIDTPIKVARYGISSVISLVDDSLIEEMRKLYCERTGEPYAPITKYDEDFRAKRITEYLNLLDRIVKKQFEELRSSAFTVGTEITKYFELLPESSPLKALYKKMLETSDEKKKQEMQQELRDSMEPGDINVNIMTKLDRPNFAVKGGAPLPSEFSDALAALRGYAQSTLKSAIIFSAGINQRLYGYVDNFKDFYADATGFIKKKIVIKVSDYRSSLIQGKFFAKKGLWVSEYRIESGLNCGGHAFATAGHLMGPILEEFKNKRDELVESLHTVYNNALQLKKKMAFNNPLPVEITAQGGIGTYEEAEFLHDNYGIDATGWGTPFLLCPDVTNVEDETIEKLSKAREDDLYLSDVSPLGVPFNNLKDNPSDREKDKRAEKGRPGSACPKGHLVSNTEFTEKPICRASRQYQKLKIDDLESKNLAADEFRRQYNEVTQKACICNDLGEGVLIKHEVPKNGVRFAAICPGPNMAYFSKISSLREMASHIYGRTSVLNGYYRPNMFIKELRCYIDYLVNDVKKAAKPLTDKQVKHFNEFKTNLMDGIEYYKDLFPKMVNQTKDYQQKALEELESLRTQLEDFVGENGAAFTLQTKTASV